MKIVSAVAALAVLLVMGCQKKEESTAFDVRTAAKKVTVTFDGIVVHALDNGVQRAVIPRLGGHRMLVTLPPSTKNAVKTLFPNAKCPQDCEVWLNTDGAAAFRIVDANGNPLKTDFKPEKPFTDYIVKLSTVSAVTGEKPFEKPEHIEDEVFEKVPAANGKVAGWFELHGGSGTAKKYGCDAKFDTEDDSAYRAFPATVTVTFADAGGLQLQIQKAGGAADWSDATTIPLTEQAPVIAVNNDMPNSNGSHFKLLNALSKMKDAQGKPLELPTVKSKATDCTPTAGPVPGCSNSAWP